MSPTIFREGPFRFYFFSREEERIHVHVQGPDGEAKFWLEPEIKLATSVGLRQHQLKVLLNMVQEHQDEIRNTWKRHSRAEVTNITPFGVWMLVLDAEKFLPFENFPWFREASVEHICSVELPSDNHLYWPELDIDLSVDSIDHPEQFPLVSNVAQQDAQHGRA